MRLRILPLHVLSILQKICQLLVNFSGSGKKWRLTDSDHLIYPVMRLMLAAVEMPSQIAELSCEASIRLMQQTSSTVDGLGCTMGILQWH